jgi:hypothetical protein
MPASVSIFDLPPAEAEAFRRNFNTHAFPFEHHLADHPLFTLPYLAKVAQSTASLPGRLYFNVGRVGIDRRWDMSKDRPFSAEEAIERIETADAWMILKSVQLQPEHGEVLRAILEEIEEVSGEPLTRTTCRQNMSVIVASPERITPYHMDEDCNFLLHISGRKTAFVFNANDPTVVTPRELEQFWHGDINAADYRQSSQEKALRFDLTPGRGIHIPVTFPHWVQNGNNVSISVSVNFCFTDQTSAYVHKVNHYIRKFGLNPKQPGRSATVDGIKKFAFKLAKRMRSRTVH